MALNSELVPGFIHATPELLVNWGGPVWVGGKRLMWDDERIVSADERYELEDWCSTRCMLWHAGKPRHTTAHVCTRAGPILLHLHDLEVLWRWSYVRLGTPTFHTHDDALWGDDEDGEHIDLPADRRSIRGSTQLSDLAWLAEVSRG